MIRALLRVLLAMAGVGAAACLALALAGMREDVRPGAAIVVLGSKVESNGRPSRRLAARLERGRALWAAGAAPVIIVSSGINPGGTDEAAVMRAWLLERGVADTAVVADPHGRNTWETARFTAAWLHAHGGRRAIAVSQYFHIARCRLAFTRFGIPETGAAWARFAEWRDLWSLPRDVLGFVKYALRPGPAPAERWTTGARS